MGKIYVIFLLLKQKFAVVTCAPIYANFGYLNKDFFFFKVQSRFFVELCIAPRVTMSLEFPA